MQETGTNWKLWINIKYITIFVCTGYFLAINQSVLYLIFKSDGSTGLQRHIDCNNNVFSPYNKDYNQNSS